MSLSRLAKIALTAGTLIGLAIVGCSSAPGQTPQTCGAGETLCGKECIDTVADPANCGACATACKPGEVCGAGACALTCGAGSTQCGASCFDTNVDAKNCGGCGKSCSAGEVCAAGKCAAQCPAQQTLCVGDGGAISCISPTTDAKNCGGCGAACDPGKVCGGGKCGDTCGVNEQLCKGMNNAPYCSAVQTDNKNCGTCGNVCSAGQTCVGGKCSGNCGLSETLCPGGDGGIGYCAKTDTDQANCGACGSVCKDSNGEICVNGKCQLQCSQGLAQCGKQCIDLTSDRDNCGKCGQPCGGGLFCAGSKCTACTNINIASLGSPTASSGGSGQYGPSNWNDGVLEINNCNVWGWISANNVPGGNEWAQYTWQAPHTITKMHMDTLSATVTNTCGGLGRTLGGVTFVQWWDGAKWVTDGKVNLLDDWDYTFTSPVTTTQIRLYDLYCTNSLGQTSNPVIFEWTVTACN